MKFEGISRKFTRKLYEWEKARGIGPEASTFALLHPGYCPIDVGRINKECNKGKWREEQKRERERKRECYLISQVKGYIDMKYAI